MHHDDDLPVTRCGRRSPDWCAGPLTLTRRTSHVTAAQGRSLRLIGVDYPPDDRFAERVVTLHRTAE